ncbi:SCO family protein [uncultured Thiohalocapsa sp.]|uniref:SCO family protein n=1 Tax=uncultured Thiohalocapsa sp. TaxID=768990 RepID=UPI0025E8A365|nr:SCO family protein [uncultured Thiohalocapsa sp.]
MPCTFPVLAAPCRCLLPATVACLAAAAVVAAPSVMAAGGHQTPVPAAWHGAPAGVQLAEADPHAHHAGTHDVHAGHADAQDAHAGDGHHAHGHHGEGHDAHAKHQAMLANRKYERSEHQYRLTDHALVSMDGSPTTLVEELAVPKPVLINFIFTTCSTICPVMSATFAKVQDELGPEASEVRMLSFSIDPEYDTPARLRAYAAQFGAGDQWQFLTGDMDELIAVQKAFDVYRGNKMNHEPTTLMRRSPDDPWVRLDGIASAADIVAEYRRLVAR